MRLAKGILSETLGRFHMQAITAALNDPVGWAILVLWALLPGLLINYISHRTNSSVDKLLQGSAQFFRVFSDRLSGLIQRYSQRRAAKASRLAAQRNERIVAIRENQHLQLLYLAAESRCRHRETVHLIFAAVTTFMALFLLEMPEFKSPPEIHAVITAVVTIALAFPLGFAIRERLNATRLASLIYEALNVRARDDYPILLETNT